MDILIVGVGKIGFELFKSINNHNNMVYCYDKSNKRRRFLVKNKCNTLDNPKGQFDCYMICVKTTGQVTDVIKKIDFSNKPFVSIETTIDPASYNQFTKLVVDKKKSYLVFFPHRYYSKDPNYHILNQTRVMAGANKQSLKKGIRFYSQFMDRNLIITTTPKYAALSHPLENSIRYVEIALAEEIAMFCKKNKLNFKEVRRIVNSKWNIDLKKANDGIKGSCLPKDIKIINKYFKGNILFNGSIKVDKKYQNTIK